MLPCIFRRPAPQPLLKVAWGCALGDVALLRYGIRCCQNQIAMKVPRKLAIEIEREADGRWIAEITALPGALAYGTTLAEAIARAKALALRVLAERLERGESAGELEGLFEAA